MSLKLEELLTEKPTDFPEIGYGLKVIQGKTLMRNRDWHKALLLVEQKLKDNVAVSLRFYGWKFERNPADPNEFRWKTRQKYNLSIGQARQLIRILVAWMLKNASEYRISNQRKAEILNQAIAELEDEFPTDATISPALVIRGKEKTFVVEEDKTISQVV